MEKKIATFQDIEHIKFTLNNSVMDRTNPRGITLSEYLEFIKTPPEYHAKRVTRIRGEKDKQKQKELKRKTETIIPSVFGSSYYSDFGEEINPIIAVDVDHNSNVELSAEEIISRASLVRGFIMGHRSISGLGATLFFYVETPCSGHFEQISSELLEKGIKVDSSTKDVLTRNYFMSMDENLVLAEKFEIRPDSDLPQVTVENIFDNFEYGSREFSEHSESFYQNMFNHVSNKVGAPAKRNYTPFITAWAGLMIHHNVSFEKSVEWLGKLSPECTATDERRGTHQDIFKRYMNSNQKVFTDENPFKKRFTNIIALESGQYLGNVMSNNLRKLDGNIIWSGVGTGKTNFVIDAAIETKSNLIVAVPTKEITESKTKESLERFSAITGVQRTKIPKIVACNGETKFDWDPRIGIYFVTFASFPELVRKIPDRVKKNFVVCIDEIHQMITWADQNFQGQILEECSRTLMTNEFKSVFGLTGTPMPELFLTGAFEKFGIIKVDEINPKVSKTFRVVEIGDSTYEEAAFKVVNSGNSDLYLALINKQTPYKFEAWAKKFKKKHYHVTSDNRTEERIRKLIDNPQTKGSLITCTSVLESGINLMAEDNIENVTVVITDTHMNSIESSIQISGRIRNAKAVEIVFLVKKIEEKNDIKLDDIIKLTNRFATDQIQSKKEMATSAAKQIEVNKLNKDHLMNEMIKEFYGNLGIHFKKAGDYFVTADSSYTISHLETAFNSYKFRMKYTLKNLEAVVSTFELLGVKYKGLGALDKDGASEKKIRKEVLKEVKERKKEQDAARKDLIEFIIKAGKGKREMLLNENPALSKSYNELQKAIAYYHPEAEETMLNDILRRTQGKSSKIRVEIEKIKTRNSSSERKIFQKFMDIVEHIPELTSDMIKKAWEMASLGKYCGTAQVLNIKTIMKKIRAFIDIKECVKRIGDRIVRVYTPILN